MWRGDAEIDLSSYIKHQVRAQHLQLSVTARQRVNVHCHQKPTAERQCHDGKPNNATDPCRRLFLPRYRLQPSASLCLCNSAQTPLAPLFHRLWAKKQSRSRRFTLLTCDIPTRHAWCIYGDQPRYTEAAFSCPPSFQRNDRCLLTVLTL